VDENWNNGNFKIAATVGSWILVIHTMSTTIPLHSFIVDNALPQTSSTPIQSHALIISVTPLTYVPPRDGIAHSECGAVMNTATLRFLKIEFEV
jgi:hypothetical protein